MTTCAFVLFDDFEDLDFFGPWEMLAHWSCHFQGPELIVASLTGQDVTSVKGLTVKVTQALIDLSHVDYLVIPGGKGTRKEVDNRKLIETIVTLAGQAQVCLSICTGAFLLEKAGILQGKKATTHWQSKKRLEDKGIDVIDDRYVNDGNVWTSAGVSAGIDMALAFIAKAAGSDVARSIQQFSEYFPEGLVY